MTNIKGELADLAEAPPPGLVRATVIAADAGDLVARTDSPFGPLWIAWSARGITALTPVFVDQTLDDFSGHHRRVAYGADALPTRLASSISDALESGVSETLLFDLRGLSEFQQAVLMSCATIEPGSVKPYGWIADELNKPGATRAVGTALAKNPIPLLIPCHRVVRSDGSVGNYAFGSEMKRELLVREGVLLGP